MTAAVLVTNPLPAQLTALSAELVARRDQLAAEIDLVEVCDLPSLERAETLFVECDRFVKQVAADRLALTRPIDAFKATIMDAERSATAPLVDRLAALKRIVYDFREAERKRREEAARLARVKSEREAAELRRQQEEQRKAELAKWEAEQAAKRAAAEEEAALFGTAAQPVASAPPPPAPAPVVAVIEAQPEPPALSKSPIKRQVRQRLVITDRAALIAAACKDGGKLYGRQILTIDESAVEALCKAAVEVPGAKLEAVEVLSATGRRS